MAKRSMAKPTGANERQETIAAFRTCGLGQAEFAEKRGLKVGAVLRMGGAVVEHSELPPPEWLVAVSRGMLGRDRHSVDAAGACLA